MIFADLWGWFDEHQRTAYATGDLDRQQFSELFSQAWSHFETNPAQSLVLLQQVRALSERLGETCWTLFFDYWICEGYLFYMNRCQPALELAVRNAMEARKPIHQDCPVRARVYRVLVDVYAHCDPVGYADQITEMVNYMEAEVPLDQDTWRLLEERRARQALVFERWEEAYAATLRYMERSGNNDFRLADAYMMLCEIAFQRRDFEALWEATLAGEMHTRRENRKGGTADFLAWKAVCQRGLGDPIQASRFYRMATAQAMPLKAKYSFYEILTEFHLAGGEYDLALQVLDRALSEATESESPYLETECRLDRCRVAVQTGQGLAEESDLAHTAAKRLLKPEYYLGRLEKVREGRS